MSCLILHCASFRFRSRFQWNQQRDLQSVHCSTGPLTLSHPSASLSEFQLNILKIIVLLRWGFNSYQIFESKWNWQNIFTQIFLSKIISTTGTHFLISQIPKGLTHCAMPESKCFLLGSLPKRWWVFLLHLVAQKYILAWFCTFWQVWVLQWENKIKRSEICISRGGAK